MYCASLTKLALLLVLVFAAPGCGSTSAASAIEPSPLPPSVGGASLRPSRVPPTLQVVFRDGKAYAREGDREWPIAEVGRDEMLWSPDGQRFLYLKKIDPPQALPGTPPRRRAAAREEQEPTETHHVVIRNIRGDPVNEFPAYRPGRPNSLDWIGNSQVGYLAPPDESGDVYVLHSVETGEILQLLRGNGFIWSPGRKHLAYVTKKKQTHAVKVNSQVIWPRSAEGPAPAPRPAAKDFRRTIIGDLVWSPDGKGLAFREQVGKQRNLVVLLVVDNEQGDLVWPLPNGAVDSENRLFWAESKIIIGTSALKPRFAASWRRLY